MSSEWVTTTTTTGFAADVLDVSHEFPVLVDFWAAWCAPCRALAPVIDELADQLAGALRVVKIDTDAEAELAARYGIRSLPTLVVFRDAAAVTAVSGVQPLSALQTLVQPWLPRAADNDLGRARQALADGDIATATAQIESALAADPTDYRLHPVLAECHIAAGRLDDARALLAALPANIALDDAVVLVSARLNLASAADGLQDDEPVAEVFRSAVDAAVAGDFDTAVAALIALLPAHRGWGEDRIRKTLLDIFSVLGNDARIKAWRAEMARVLN